MPRPLVLLIATMLTGLAVAAPSASASGDWPGRCYSENNDASDKYVNCDSVKLPELGGIVAALAPGTMLPTRRPGSWTSADVNLDRTKSEVGVGYNAGDTGGLGGKPSGVSVTALPGSVRHARASLLRAVRRSVYRPIGDRLTVRTFTAGPFHGTSITALTGKSPSRGWFTYRDRYYLWGSGGLVYTLHAHDVHGDHLTYSLSRIVGSFAPVS